MKKLFSYSMLKAVELQRLTTDLSEKETMIRKATSFIKDVEMGNLDTLQLTDDLTNDPLASALLSMRQRMKAISEEERKRNWVTQGLATFVEILRVNNEDIKALTAHIISNVVKYMEANQGTLFIVNDDKKDDPYLEMIASYAYDKKKFISKRINIGDGMTGQAFLEKATIYMTDIPKDYIKITSGLGEALPANVLIVPLKINEEVYGIIEIATFELMQPYQIEFVEKLGESIASTIANVKNSQQTRQLLSAAQQQAEEMKSQEEEIRQNMEELSATQEEVLRKQGEANNLLERFDLITRTTTEGLWDMVMPADQNVHDNTPFFWADNFRHMLGYENETDFPNVLHSWSDLLHMDHKQNTLNAFGAHLMDLSGKTQFDVEYQLKLKNGSYRWFRAVGNTLRDAKGNPLRVAGSLIDIQLTKDMSALKEDLENKVAERTASMEAVLSSAKQNNEDLKAQEEELRQNMEELATTQEEMQRVLNEVQGKETFLNEIINSSKDSIFILDAEFKVISANKAFTSALEVAGIKAEKGFDMLSIFQHDPIEVEKQRANYKRAFSGEVYETVDHSVLNGIESYYAISYSPLKKDNGEVFAIAVFAKDVTEIKKAQQASDILLQKFNLVTRTSTEGLWDMAVPENLEFNDDTPFNWSDRFRNMLGYDNEKDFPNVLCSWSDLLHPDHKQNTLSAFTAHLIDLTGNTPYNVEYQLKLKDNSYRWFRAVGNTLRSKEGNPLLVAGSLIDIQDSRDLALKKKDGYDDFLIKENEYLAQIKELQNKLNMK